MAEEKDKVEGAVTRPQKEKLARGIVARGRSVQVPDNNQQVIKGTNPETGKLIYGPKIREYGPGEEVTLPESELKYFRELGYIVDPTKIADEVPAEGSRLTEVAS